MYSFLLLLFFSISLSVVSAIIFFATAEKIGIVDVPGGRKQHHNNTPLIGGFIIFVGCLAFPLYRLDMNYFYLYFLIFSALLLGFLDDLFDLSASIKLVFQLIIGFLLATLLDLKLVNAGNLFGLGEVFLGGSSVVFICFATAASKNALNMIDGVDGLAASLALLPVGVLFFVFFRAGAFDLANFSITIIGGLLVFLYFNYPFPWRKNAICFLGDSGSTLLGLLVVYLLIKAASMGLLKPVVALYLFAMPLIDSAGVIFRRIMRGAAPSSAGRDHFHHILIDGGLSPRQTTSFILFLGVLLAVVGVVLDFRKVPEFILFYLFLMLIFLNLIMLVWFSFFVRIIVAFSKRLFSR
jgi:UDP-GlcNAc:undecaprenyl-phosphate GlcNAc-1-phosphate transferase